MDDEDELLDVLVAAETEDGVVVVVTTIGVAVPAIPVPKKALGCGPVSGGAIGTVTTTGLLGVGAGVEGAGGITETGGGTTIVTGFGRITPSPARGEVRRGGSTLARFTLVGTLDGVVGTDVN